MRTRKIEEFVRDWASHLCETDESRVTFREELTALVSAAWDGGLEAGRAEMRAEIERLIEGLAK